MTEQIKFAGEQGNLTIEVHGYERPATEDQDDANWLRCGATIKAGPFTGAFNIGLTTHDVTALREQLKNALATMSDSVSFSSIENDISFDIRFDKRGSAIISGTVQPHRSLTASLAFRFDTDQSYLTQTLCQLDAVTHRFPIKHRLII